jgi:hypothetical protein
MEIPQIQLRLKSLSFKYRHPDTTSFWHSTENLPSKTLFLCFITRKSNIEKQKKYRKMKECNIDRRREKRIEVEKALPKQCELSQL